jgi:hypothetical protein
MKGLESTVCTLSDNHHQAARKLSKWTRKIDFWAWEDCDGPKAPALYVDYIVSVLFHTRELVQLSIDFPITTSMLTEVTTFSAASLRSLSITWTPNSWSAFGFIGSLRGLQTLDMTALQPPDDSRWTYGTIPLERVRAWELPSLAQFSNIFSEEMFRSPDYVPFCTFLSRCQFSGLINCGIWALGLETPEHAQGLRVFLRAHHGIQSLSLNTRAEAMGDFRALAHSEALKRLSLHFVPQPQAIPHLPNSLTTLVLQRPSPRFPSEGLLPSLLPVLEALAQARPARSQLSRLELDFITATLRFMWRPSLHPYADTAAVEYSDRLTPYALRLLEQGIAVFDSFGEAFTPE